MALIGRCDRACREMFRREGGTCRLWPGSAEVAFSSVGKEPLSTFDEAMERLVETEWLDTLPARDSRAMRSRSDLRRVNRLLGNVDVLERLLRCAKGPSRLVDLGAGDGTFLLRLARRLAPRWGRTTAVLVDQHDLLSAATREGFLEIGWTIESVQADAFEWLAGQGNGAESILTTNLFLHHFNEERLRSLFQLASSRSCLFAACEPRRKPIALTASRLLGLIGCNAVTRHDGPVSVRAGFAARELSTLWPRDADWELREDAAGLFGHCFLARRVVEGRSESA